MTPDQRLEIVKRHVSSLMEHFETVQVFVTKTDNDDQGTHAFNSGNGNWYARYGQIQEWMVQQSERASIQIRREDSDEDSADA